MWRWRFKLAKRHSFWYCDYSYLPICGGIPIHKAFQDSVRYKSNLEKRFKCEQRQKLKNMSLVKWNPYKTFEIWKWSLKLEEDKIVLKIHLSLTIPCFPPFLLTVQHLDKDFATLQCSKEKEDYLQINEKLVGKYVE